MRPTFKRLEVKDLGNFEKLVAENIEGIEPGLRVLDSRLVLGQAAIDLVALDASESLVLVALDFMADEGLLLRAMDAYSWCLEYPDTLRRLYPMANVAPTRPPRIMFIVERLTDAFVRRIKHLSFLEIDCLEFRHLEVNGASAVYFDLVERLRRGASAGPRSDERVIPTTPVRTQRRIEAEPPVVERAPRAVAEPKGGASRPPAVRDAAPFETLGATGTVATANPERVVSLETRLAELLAEASAAHVAPVGETTSTENMPFAVQTPPLETLSTATMPEAGETPSAEELPSAVEMPTEEHATEAELADSTAPVHAEEIAEAPELQFESVDAAAQQEEPDVPSVAARVAANPDWQALLNQLGVEIPGPSKGTKAASTERANETPMSEGPAATEDTSAPAVEEVTPALEDAAPAVEEEPVVEEAAPPVEEPVPAPVEAPAPSRTLPAWAKPSANRVVQPVAGRTYFFSQAAKGTTPTDTQAATPAAGPVTEAPPPAQTTPAPTYLRPAVPAQPSAWPPAPPAGQTEVPAPPPAAAPSRAAELVANRPELEALHFPKDGLSRQWLEFLNQLGGTK